MKRVCKAVCPGLESRFQRLPFIQSKPWGDAPGLDEGAPLALKINGAADSLSAKGGVFIESLGQRPRTLARAKLPALKDEGAHRALKTNAAADSLSAKGGVFIESLGHRPRTLARAKLPALKTRFIPEIFQ